jgi:undecaprenyl-diphosphatase
MNVTTAFLLGLIQGLTEFLPVSSSGHLELAKIIFDTDSLAKESLLFTLILHGATALSTLVVFQKDIRSLFIDLFKFTKNESFYFACYIVLSMIPATLVGLFLEDLITSLFFKNNALVGAMLLLTGGLLFLADRAKATTKNINSKSAILIGLMQAVAILPGISRSGATIATAVLLGVDKEKAARFSFLMVIPLIFGSMAKSILDAGSVVLQENTTTLIVGFVSAFFVGVIACKWMIDIVKKAQLRYFSWYCFAVGIIAIFIL